MGRLISLAALTTSIALGAAGCCCMPCGPCGGGQYGGGAMAGDCGPCAQPCNDCIGCPLGDLFELVRPSRVLRAGCSGACAEGCDTCAAPASCCGLGGWLGWGCGPRYWGDFWGDPHSRCESCDCHGNWTGPTGHHGSWYGGSVMYKDGHHGHPTPALESVPSRPAPPKRPSPAPARPAPTTPDLKPMPTDEAPPAATEEKTEEKTTRFVPRTKKSRTSGQPTPVYNVRTTSGWQPRQAESR
jgi:hypothetical protein